jgi:hypothetical protein
MDPVFFTNRMLHEIYLNLIYSHISPEYVIRATLSAFYRQK